MDSEEAGRTVGRWASAALLACGIFTTIGLFAPALLLPQIERHFANVAHGSLLTQLIGGIACFFFTVGSPLSGLLIARFGCRKVIGSSLLLFTLSGIAPMGLDDLGLIVASRALVGLGVAGIFTGALTGISQLPEARRHRMFGLVTVTGAVASFILFPTVAELAKQGWRLGFLVYLAGLVVLPWTVAIPKELGRVRPSSVRHFDQPSGAFFNPRLVGLLLVSTMTGMAMFVTGLYTPLYLSSALNITDPRVLAIPNTLGSVVAPFAAAAYAPVFRRIGLHGVTTTALLGLSAAFALCGSVDNLIPFTAAMILGGAMFALMATNVSASALAYSTPRHASTALGLANGVLFGTQLLTPFAITAIRSVASPASVFFVFAAALGGAGLLTFLTRPAASPAIPDKPDPALT